MDEFYLYHSERLAYWATEIIIETDRGITHSHYAHNMIHEEVNMGIEYIPYDNIKIDWN